MPPIKVDHGEQIWWFVLSITSRVDQGAVSKVANGADLVGMVEVGWPERAVNKSRQVGRLEQFFFLFR
jgi:hypothetical protein